MLRRFGRWHRTPRRPGRPRPAPHVGRSSVLVDVLAARLATRRVVESRPRVEEVTATDGRRRRIVGVRTAAGSRPAAAVVLATDPWHRSATCPRAPRRRCAAAPDRRCAPPRGAERSRTPALRPAVPRGVIETVQLDRGRRPVIRSARPARRRHDRTRCTTTRRTRAAPGGRGWPGGLRAAGCYGRRSPRAGAGPHLAGPSRPPDPARRTWCCPAHWPRTPATTRSAGRTTPAGRVRRPCRAPRILGCSISC